MTMLLGSLPKQHQETAGAHIKQALSRKSTSGKLFLIALKTSKEMNQINFFNRSQQSHIITNFCLKSKTFIEPATVWPV
jgi:hypothetical protein